MAKSTTSVKKAASKKAPLKKVVKKTASVKATVKKAAPEKAAATKTAPKKVVVKSAGPAKKENTIKIKYEDKSAGQPEMVEIFYNIEMMLKPYDKKRSLVLHNDKPSQAHLVSHKPVEIGGKTRNELWFASALVQKGYVGFYYSPRYVDGDLKKHFSDAFVKCLKGGGCFHIKKNDPALMADIKKAIKIGYEACIEKDWI
ncbi:MAG: hypothetical protein JWQ30_2666 [Sediminibacterium sp.]|nr:hypothetical protein [Sediminibacterium sp.]